MVLLLSDLFCWQSSFPAPMAAQTLKANRHTLFAFSSTFSQWSLLLMDGLCRGKCAYWEIVSYTGNMTREQEVRLLALAHWHEGISRLLRLVRYRKHLNAVLVVSFCFNFHITQFSNEERPKTGYDPIFYPFFPSCISWTFLRSPKEIYQTNRFINNGECWEPFKIMRRRAWSCQSSCTWPFAENSHRLNISYFIKPSLGCRHRVSTILPFRLFQISSSLIVCVFLFLFLLMSYSLRFSTVWFAPSL